MEEEILKTLVTSGVGLSVMVAEEALAGKKEGEIVIWPKDQLEVDLSFVYLRERKNDLVIQAILNGIFIVWDITGQWDRETWKISIYAVRIPPRWAMSST